MTCSSNRSHTHSFTIPLSVPVSPYYSPRRRRFYSPPAAGVGYLALVVSFSRLVPGWSLGASVPPRCWSCCSGTGQHGGRALPDRVCSCWVYIFLSPEFSPVSVLSSIFIKGATQSNTCCQLLTPAANHSHTHLLPIIQSHSPISLKHTCQQSFN